MAGSKRAKDWLLASGNRSKVSFPNDNCWLLVVGKLPVMF
jgi:hypothetical protein